MTQFSRRDVLGAIGATAVTLSGCLGTGSQSAEQVESLPSPVQGDPNADVTVMVFEDFSCGHCQSWVLDHLPAIATDYIEPGAIRYEHHDFPIPVDSRWSWDVAVAARSVQDTVGDEAFFEFAHTMYENLGNYSESVVRRAANDVGADGDAVVSDMNGKVYRPVVKADRDLGSENGVRGTPTVFVNGAAVDNYAAKTVSRAIENEL